MPDEFDVFLSHNSRDKPVVEEIATRLRDRGLRVWLDKDELRPGFPWQEGLEEAVQASRSVAVFVGKDGLGVWEQPEMRAFLARSRREKIPVIPVLLPGCPDSPQLTPFLEAFTWVDLRDGLTDEGLAGLVWGITGTKGALGSGERPARSRYAKIPRLRWSWGIGLSLLGVLLTLAAWLWPCSSEPPPPPPKPEIYAVRVQVLDPQGLPVRGATIRASAGNEPQLLPDGWWQVEIPEVKVPADGRISLWAEHEEWEGNRVDLRLGADPNPRVEISLKQPETWLQGQDQVVDEGSRALPGTRDSEQGGQPKSEFSIPQETRVTAAVRRMLLVVRDLAEHPLSGFRFAYRGAESEPTNRAGATALDLPSDHRTGQQIKIQLLPDSTRVDEWFLVNPLVNVPSISSSAEVVLMRRNMLRNIATAVRPTPSYITTASTGPRAVAITASLWTSSPGFPISLPDSWESSSGRYVAVATPLGYLTEEDRRRALVDAAARYGLAAEQFETALRSFAETQDTKDRGIAAYLEGQFSLAEVYLREAGEKKESDLVETLRYLGTTQYEQGKYHAAASTFRKAVALRPEDRVLLSWLGVSLRELADWAEAESLLRRTLEIDKRILGTEHPNVARDLNDLAVLLQATNRLAEAEPLMRHALSIDEKSFGPDHPDVARDLNNLAQLLQTTNRLGEAEPLMRRALAIDEKSFGPDHPNVAQDLGNLAQLLEDMNRLAESEPLMRRVLAIDEKSFGPDHPNVARDLNNLAQLLHATNRLGEAESLMRRALAIDEKSFGPKHPNVARDLNNLAQLLQATNRLGEAEPLMRRALAIDEKSFGPKHPNVARNLNNLAWLLTTKNRLEEAEPIMRQALAILLEFERRTDHEHPYGDAVSDNYRMLLKEMGKSDAEIEATIRGLVETPE